jgi:hypothetical protein
MKKKLSFPCLLAFVMLINQTNMHSTSEISAHEVFSAALPEDLFNSILDSCPPETPNLLSLPRNAHSVPQAEHILQKMRTYCIRCYAYILCRYYTFQKWLKTSSKKA